MNHSLTIPARDLDEFGMLPLKDRNEVLAWLDALKFFDDATNKAIALSSLQVRYAGRLKITKSTLYRKRQGFEAQGWRGLINGARASGRASRELPEEFIQFWQVLCADNQRKTAPAYRSLFFDHLIRGTMIPGYHGDWRRIWTDENRGFRIPEHCPYSPDRLVPIGWSMRNLARYAPDKFMLAASRIGMGHASQYLPRIPTTRAGLRIGQFYVVDDMEHDVKVNFAGNRKAYTPLELGALDLLTGHYASWGLKPIRELDNGEREHIRKHYMRALMVHLLCIVGYDPEGCTILGEHGTATLDADTVKRINVFAQGKISFDAGGLQGAPIAKGLFDGRPRGNSRFKAALESHHNLKHNELAHLPGQKGKDWGSAPEDDYGRGKVNNALVKACIALEEARPDLINELSLPYMQFDRFREFVSLAYDRIANRMDHHLEGFEEAGFTIQEYRMDPSMPWLPMAQLKELPGPARSAVELVINSNPEKLVNCRYMSPAEAWKQNEGNLTRLSLAAAPDILGPEFGHKATVNDHAEIVISDPDYRDRKHVFSAGIKTLDGAINHLNRKREIIVHLISPIDASFALISSPDGSFLGVAPALTRGCRTDTETLHKNLGIRSQALSHELRKLQPVANKRLRDREDADRRNLEALSGRDPAAEREEQEDISREAKKATRGRGTRSDIDDIYTQKPAPVLDDLPETEEDGLDRIY